MRIFRHHEGVPADVRGAAVALGNFDGVHRGHQVVINAAGEHARRLNVPHAVVTFEPHPRQVFRPEDAPFRLTPFRAKARCIEDLGVDLMFSLHFDRNFATRSPENFVSEVLIDALGVRHLAVGWDFVFGRQRSGNAAFLHQAVTPLGVEISVIDPICGIEGEDGKEGALIISSTRVREHLGEGDAKKAAVLLGRPWEIDGRVEHGDQRGRTLNFPTANIAMGDFLRPRAGVYAVRIGIEREGSGLEWRGGVANIGSRPTVNGTDLRLEAHIFDFSEDLYGRHLRVALVDWIRAEQRFAGLDALKAQIAFDANRAREMLALDNGQP